MRLVLVVAQPEVPIELGTVITSLIVLLLLSVILCVGASSQPFVILRLAPFLLTFFGADILPHVQAQAVWILLLGLAD